MLNNKTYKIAELIILFVVIPIALAFPFFIGIKIAIVLLAIVYCLWLSINQQLFSKKDFFQLQQHRYWKKIVVYFFLIAFSTTFLVWKFLPENFFVVVKKAPLFWIGLILFYCIFSVYPQELLYRLFFFKRYATITSSTSFLISINILIFPLAHLFFHSWLVLLITIIGGVLFSISYHKTKSLLVTFLEHSLYGSWLFTVGMGELLGFPSP